jgi:hypothetical protein
LVFGQNQPACSQIFGGPIRFHLVSLSSLNVADKSFGFGQKHLFLTTQSRYGKIRLRAEFLFSIFRGGFKTFQFGQGQGGRSFQPQEYIEYFED